MKKNTKQYTIRGITFALDKQLKKIAQKRTQSLNAWMLTILTKSSGLAEEAPSYHDLDPLCGRWVKDKEVMKTLVEQREIDKKLWE